MESLATPIEETISVFDIQNDLDLIDTINNKIQQMDSIKDQNITSFSIRVDDLKQQLENTLSSIKSLKSSSQTKSTKSELRKLENEIFNTARNLTSLNMEINTLKLSYNQNLKRLDELESELSKLNDKFVSGSVNLQLNDSKSVDENTNLIKLKLYQSIGLKFNSHTQEVLILNKKKNNVSLLKIDDTYSEYFISNFIWDNI
ncbi:kinetochore-associated Ndc80 complex subunit spc24 [Pichia californica]|nr:kinetochore-associated Ndc80 complex subunit spc24 [[Candida] californica]